MYAGKCRIALSRSTRLKVALGAAARGLAYLHEHAGPHTIQGHQVKQHLLDEDYNAKVSDYRLSKSTLDDDKDHDANQVKGTMVCIYIHLLRIFTTKEATKLLIGIFQMRGDRI